MIQRSRPTDGLLSRGEDWSSRARGNRLVEMDLRSRGGQGKLAHRLCRRGRGGGDGVKGIQPSREVFGSAGNRALVEWKALWGAFELRSNMKRLPLKRRDQCGVLGKAAKGICPVLGTSKKIRGGADKKGVIFSAEKSGRKSAGAR